MAEMMTLATCMDGWMDVSREERWEERKSG